MVGSFRGALRTEAMATIIAIYTIVNKIKTAHKMCSKHLSATHAEQIFTANSIYKSVQSSVWCVAFETD